jgi:hypothetical protein
MSDSSDKPVSLLFAAIHACVPSEQKLRDVQRILMQVRARACEARFIHSLALLVLFIQCLFIPSLFFPHRTRRLSLVAIVVQGRAGCWLDDARGYGIACCSGPWRRGSLQAAVESQPARARAFCAGFVGRHRTYARHIAAQSGIAQMYLGRIRQIQLHTRGSEYARLHRPHAGCPKQRVHGTTLGGKG